MARDILSARQDFPILDIQVNERPLVYLDNAATTQKPQVVIDTLRDYYTRYNANIHRGNYAIAYEATEAYEKHAQRSRAISTLNISTRLSSRVARRNQLIWWHIVLASVSWAKAMKSSSLNWNITVTMCPGNYSANEKKGEIPGCSFR